MKYAIATLGCKVNQFETQALETILRSRGHKAVRAGADAVIVNTCAVTGESERKSRQALRRLLKENPGAVAAVCGCFSQLSPETSKELGADVVFGTGDKQSFAEAVEAAVARREEKRSIDDPFRRRSFETLPPGAIDGHARAYLKIQDGCDNFCAYCVIPYARGRVRSMPPETAAAQAVSLVSAGFREIVLTGIEIASYGKDFQDGTSLIDAVEAVSAAASEKARLRLGSLEPTVVTPEFCRRLFACGGAGEKICRHFHLSLQSGCDRVLRAMGRKYDTARFDKSAALLREYFPGCALTADLICGFPGETEEDFEDTLSFIRACSFASMHIFPYSPRPGTKAAAMEGQLPRAEKERRAGTARRVAAETRRDYLKSQLGEQLPVLFETEGDGRFEGHADNYCLVRVPGERGGMRGTIKNVKILTTDGQILMGNIV